VNRRVEKRDEAHASFVVVVRSFVRSFVDAQQNIMGVLGTLLHHPGDVIPLVKVKRMADKAKRLPKEKNLAYCYDVLNKVSRSFAIVIQQLDEELRDAVCVFYLVLRALDTIEDDMAIPIDEKLPQLLEFYQYIYDPAYSTNCGEKHYKDLMANYPKVTAVFLKLKKPYREVIADITRRMGAGMAKFIEKEVMTMEDFDEYCHYVAGLVGIGLSNLWGASKMESKEFIGEEKLSNAMGLFLQKTNIIRDYLEDIQELPAPRMFWPRSVWSKYAKELDDLQHEENREAAVQCMNELITNALHHSLDCMKYMARIKEASIFRFCAIPQVMAIATLAECYGNENVFRGVVKIRRGLSARIMLKCNNMLEFATGFKYFANQLVHKVQPNKDPNGEETLRAIEALEEVCDKIIAEESEKMHIARVNDDSLPMSTRMLLWFLFGGYFTYAWRLEEVRESLGVNRHAGDPRVDAFQRWFATICFIIISLLVIVGKKR
jgi:farnesyl-diphosphate farnesyltransferase